MQTKQDSRTYVTHFMCVVVLRIKVGFGRERKYTLARRKQTAQQHKVETSLFFSRFRVLHGVLPPSSSPLRGVQGHKTHICLHIFFLKIFVCKFHSAEVRGTVGEREVGGGRAGYRRERR